MKNSFLIKFNLLLLLYYYFTLLLRLDVLKCLLKAHNIMAVQLKAKIKRACICVGFSFLV